MTGRPASELADTVRPWVGVAWRGNYPNPIAKDAAREALDELVRREADAVRRAEEAEGVRDLAVIREAEAVRRAERSEEALEWIGSGQHADFHATTDAEWAMGMQHVANAALGKHPLAAGVRAARAALRGEGEQT